MKITINSIKKTALLAGGLFLSVLSANADDVQKSIDFNYLRAPEAAAFKKYGEESVNEYTGTADISVPLYTIKCKDIEIPLVLRYDASGIKVEQEASWVGLGWNLMVGGCINYVCAGDHDQHNGAAISDQTWQDYLTNRKTTSAYQTISKYPRSWMETVSHSFAFECHPDNLSMDMRNYLMWGFGERDFYSVNVLGKSFKFFIDPATLKAHVIGEAGEDYKIETTEGFLVSERGLGRQLDVKGWTITDSSGYIYHFSNGDKVAGVRDLQYTICWYLTGIQTPSGENVKLSYTKHQEWERAKVTESFSVLSESVRIEDEKYANQGYSSSTHSAWVFNSFLEKIETSNQIVTFITKENNYDCSGRELDSIIIKSYNGTPIKTIGFSYGTFGCSNVGGNFTSSDKRYSDYRLRLGNVKEISSRDTLTTSFSYNYKDLPSKRSCAQDYWGYYNGKENYATSAEVHGINGHTLIPTPTNFMTKQTNQPLGHIKGADRFSDGEFMQAGMLTEVRYPTGGYTKYEYEPNSILVHTTDFTQPKGKGGSEEEKKYDISILARYTVSTSPYGMVLDEKDRKIEFELTKVAICDLSLQCDAGANSLYGQKPYVEIRQWNTSTHKYDLYKKIIATEAPLVENGLTLSQGKYYIGISFDNKQNSNYPFSIRCYLNGCFKEKDIDLKSILKPDTITIEQTEKLFPLTVGGLRIKKIRNYDSDDKLINSTEYDYSGGKLLNEIETIDAFNYSYIKPEPNGLGPATAFSSHSISGWNISTGHTRFPAFFESCNPGIVGYNTVTKKKYNANGSLEKSVVTSYKNDKPESLTLIDYYKCLENGKMLSQKILDANEKVVLKVENKYRTHYLENDEKRDRWYCTNMIARDGIVVEPNIGYFDELNDPICKNRFMVWKYPYILSRIDLIKTTTTEYYNDNCDSLVLTKEYEYKDNYDNIQLCQIDEKNLSQPNLIQRTKIKYSSDIIDNVSKWMVANTHRLNDVVEKKVILVENGKENIVSTQRSTYKNLRISGTDYYLLSSDSTSVGNAKLKIRATYSYDDFVNVRSIETDGMKTVYLWSYNGQYPVAKIEGLTYAEVETAVGKTTISNLLKAQSPNLTTLNTIRSNISAKGGLVTTYTFKPLIGMLSETQPNGNTIYYTYGAFGRLKDIRDIDGKILQKYSYNYKNK